VRTAAAGFDHLVYVTKAKGEAPSSTCYLVGPRYDTAPVPISLLKPACTIISVAAGEHHTLLLSDGGEIFAIGSNLDGQLGVPSVKHQAGEGFNSTEPVLIPGIAGTAIAAGARHSVCIDRQGRCFAWGSSLHGQCGNAENGTESNQSSVSIAQPSLVEALGPLKCVSIAAGMRHTLCSTSTGDVYGWGSNEDGELACSEPGTTYVSRPRLVDDPALENEHIVKVSACGRHSLALSNSGKVFSWGFGVFGQLGSGKLQASSSTNTASNTCTEIDLPAVGDAVAGWWHSLFLVKDDHVRG
jgi:alpha-tubulin suppressor-like RCC1 family protein